MKTTPARDFLQVLSGLDQRTMPGAPVFLQMKLNSQERISQKELADFPNAGCIRSTDITTTKWTDPRKTRQIRISIKQSLKS